MFSYFVFLQWTRIIIHCFLKVIKNCLNALLFFDSGSKLFKVKESWKNKNSHMEYVTFWIWDVRRRAFICLSLIVMCESNFPLLWESVTKNHYPWNGFVWYKKIRVSSSLSECIHIRGSSHACAEGKSCDTAFVLCGAQSLVENVQCNRGITQGDIMENPNWYQSNSY